MVVPREDNVNTRITYRELRNYAEFLKDTADERVAAMLVWEHRWSDILAAIKLAESR
jgi:hypothetical protein